MPFEFGMDYSCRELGISSTLNKKRWLILEGKEYSLQKAISDINELDPKPHNNDKIAAIRHVRNFLAGDKFAPKDLPGEERINGLFDEFDLVLTKVICKEKGFNRDKLTFFDFRDCATTWIKTGYN